MALGLRLAMNLLARVFGGPGPAVGDGILRAGTLHQFLLRAGGSNGFILRAGT